MKTNMINGSFHTYRWIHFISGNALFWWYLSEIIREDRVSQRPPGRVPTCLKTALVIWTLERNSDNIMSQSGSDCDWHMNQTTHSTKDVATLLRLWLIALVCGVRFYRSLAGDKICVGIIVDVDINQWYMNGVTSKSFDNGVILAAASVNKLLQGATAVSPKTFINLKEIWQLQNSRISLIIHFLVSSNDVNINRDCFQRERLGTAFPKLFWQWERHSQERY